MNWFFGNKEKPWSVNDHVRESGGWEKIVNGYRLLAEQKNSSPTSEISDKKMIELYKKVGVAFYEASRQRGEFITPECLNFIVWRFFQFYEMMGDQMFDSHLEYEIERYVQSGLHMYYRQTLNLY